MAVVASTSDDYYANFPYQSSEQRRNPVRVPTNGQENRRLKFGHSDDDNADIAYLNFSMLWPSAIFTASSLICFVAAIISSLDTDYIPTERELLRGFIIKYGSSRIRCNSSLPFPTDGLPSILNLFELNVIGNVLFRYSTCIPIAVRIFHAHTLRNLLRHEYGEKYSTIHRIASDLMPLFTGLEAIMMALFSIVTVHEDFPEANRFFKIVFAMTSVVNMMATSLVVFNFSANSQHRLDSISIGVKLICTAVYSYFTPQYIQYHQSAITFPICHSYLPHVFAMMEYAIIAAYGLFHLSILIDIRHVSFICYPRSCSGECEPLDPDNFEKGAKYEHCRAFEYNQRRVMNL